jgi:germination protein M
VNRKRLLICAAALLISAALSACGGEEPSGRTVGVYYAVNLTEQDALAGLITQREEVALPDGSNPLDFALRAMRETPGNPALRSVFTQSGARVLNVTEEDGCAVISLSEEFAGVTGLNRTVAEYCMLQTAIQFEGITAIRWVLSGASAQSGESSAVISAGDFIDAPLELVSARHTIKLYFADEDYRLVPETRSVVMRESESPEWYRQVVEGLIAGPFSGGLNPVIPEKTRLLSVTTDNRVCAVNLSRDFMSPVTGSSREARTAVLALVNSLTELPGVVFVKIRVEGEDVGDYFGSDLSLPLERDEEALGGLEYGEAAFDMYYPSAFGGAYIPVVRYLPAVSGEKPSELMRLEKLLSGAPPSGLPDCGLNLLTLESFRAAEDGGFDVIFGADTTLLLDSGAVSETALYAVCLTLRQGSEVPVRLFAGTQNLAPRLIGAAGDVDTSALTVLE